MSEEVRFGYMRPQQMIKRRDECPIAYIPLGTLEWHGYHNPFGTDSFTAEHLSVLCAQTGGGLVMPTLHWGDNRLEGIIDAKPDEHEAISTALGCDPERSTPARWMREERDQNRLYHDLLLHILNQTENYGFKVAVFICGHHPFADRATGAVLEYNKGCRKTGKMLAWATAEVLHLFDRYDYAGGHSAGWETSYLLASHPELVDLSVLPPRGEKIPGVFGVMPPHDASAELGGKLYRQAAEAIVKEARSRLNNPLPYRRQGCSVRLGIVPLD